jgi:glycosyltransferase involved in cell wall biosynthesis
VTTVDNFTWFDHPPVKKHVHPKTDAVIAVSIGDIAHMDGRVPSNAKRAVWLRGWHKWHYTSDQMYVMLRKFKGRILCNSSWLVEKLRKNGIEAILCYSGLDVSFWLKVRHEPKSPLRIGCLYNRTHKTKQWDWFRELKKLAPEHEYVAFGSHKPKDCSWLDSFLLTPKPEKLRRFYAKCDIWFAPSKLEGFSNVPAEAALCGCLVFGLARSSAGTNDWLDDKSGHLFTSPQNAAEQLRNPCFERIDEAQYRLAFKIGPRKKAMKRFARLMK